MKKIIWISLVCFSAPLYLTGADHYEHGDTLYVWSKNGLNLRSGPGTSFDVLNTIPYGEQVIARRKTGKSYNLKAIELSEYTYYLSKTDPVIFYGQWIELELSDGTRGYAIDTYLLRFKPAMKNIQSDFLLDLEVVAKGDTEKTENGEYVETVYKHQISKIEGTWGYLGYEDLVIPGVSLQEVLILFSAPTDNYAQFGVYKNWEEEIILYGNEICTFFFKQKENSVVIRVECSC